MVLFSAETSDCPYIHNPFHPPIGPMTLLLIVTKDDLIPKPEPSEEPEIVLRSATTIAPSYAVIPAPSAGVIVLSEITNVYCCPLVTKWEFVSIALHFVVIVELVRYPLLERRKAP